MRVAVAILPRNSHVHGVSLGRFELPGFPMNWYYFRDKAAVRLHLRTCTVMLLAIVGIMIVVDGCYRLDLSKLRIALDRDGIAIDGGVEILAMGMLVLYGAYRLLLRWFGD
jgi:hypothetical protein